VQLTLSEAASRVGVPIPIVARYNVQITLFEYVSVDMLLNLLGQNMELSQSRDDTSIDFFICLIITLSKNPADQGDYTVEPGESRP
jgi:hypothetical protein